MKTSNFQLPASNFQLPASNFQLPTPVSQPPPPISPCLSFTPNYINNIIVLISIMLFVASCEKEVTIEVPDPDPKIVIEGYIENGQPARVLITWNSPYFGEVPTDEEALLEMMVLDAVVSVSDGSVTEQLYLTVDTTADLFPPIFYRTYTMLGEVGKQYSLQVIAEGDTLTAKTVIPVPIPLDTVWIAEEGTLDTLGSGFAVLTDPDTLGNCYKLFTKRIDRDNRFYAFPDAAFDDKYFNGKSFEFYFYRAQNIYSTDEGDQAYYFKKGEFAVIKFCTIDPVQYNFWRSVTGEIYGQGNPFATPSTVYTNIEGGGLGIWGGLGATYDTVYFAD